MRRRGEGDGGGGEKKKEEERRSAIKTKLKNEKSGLAFNFMSPP